MNRSPNEDLCAREDTHYMRWAIDLAREAEKAEEVPVGAILVRDAEILGEGYNRPIGEHDPTAHAEILALRAAAQRVSNYRLPGATLYVTLEPCIMCVGAIVHARVKRVVFGARDPKTGVAGSVFNVLESDRHNHLVSVSEGVLEEECGRLLTNFFTKKRQKGVNS